MKLRKSSATSTFSFQIATKPTTVSTATEVTTNDLCAALALAVTVLSAPARGRCSPANSTSIVWPARRFSARVKAVRARRSASVVGPSVAERLRGHSPRAATTFPSAASSVTCAAR